MKNNKQNINVRSRYTVSRIRKRKYINKYRIRLFFLIMFIVIMVIFTIRFKGKQDQSNVQISITKEEKEEPIKKDDVEINILDNSGYLDLKDDPNADDANIVAVNTKEAIIGTTVYPVRTDGKKVAYLTFDDGPSTTNTPKILEILDRYNIKGTFFVLGKSIESSERSKEILREQVKRGHAIANHSYSHDYSYLYPNGIMNIENIVSDFEKNNNILKEVLGKDFSTRTIRFPGGYWSWDGREPMRDKIIELGYCNVDWNVLNGDAEGWIKNSDELYQITKEGIENLAVDADSVVILMHDTYGKEETVKSLPKIIEYLQSEGYEFRTMK